jgi:hypothetical protein
MWETEGTGISEAREQIVRTELIRLLEGPAFRTSKRCKEFLEYIVEHTIHGPSGTLKERSIGVELFGLPQDFDTGQHTIVRVTANEVRKKLARHYLDENGSYHPVRIDLPPGSYSADFKWDTPAAEPPSAVPAAASPPVVEPAAPPPSAPEPPVAPPGRPSPRTAAAWAVVVLVVVGASAWWRWGAGKTGSADAKSSVSGAAILGEELRMVAGSANPYVDRNGRTWTPERYFSGGSALVRPSEKIVRTLDPDIYRHLRYGEFRYDIPLKPGSYELHLHFAETGLADSISAESSGEGQRLFNVSANGRRILTAFDVVADAAGANVADERVFRNISPAEDGFLHLSFTPMKGSAMLSGIEVLPDSPGTLRPVRIRAGWLASWQDPEGKQWQGDSHFIGGNALVRPTNPAEGTGSVTPDLALYASERWGHFSYSLPVAGGRYQVTLKFCEGHYGKRNTGVGGIGSRVFDVYCNGIALLREFDIYKEAGGEGRAIDRTFTGIRPTAQGKIVLTFVPVVGMACVNGIEVVESANR